MSGPCASAVARADAQHRWVAQVPDQGRGGQGGSEQRAEDRSDDAGVGARAVSGLRNGVLERFWVIPLLCAAAAAGLGLAMTGLDALLDTSFTLPLLFAGGPEGARALLSAIITSMISFTGLVFSITIVVMQLTSSQFSPRVLRTFLRDWFDQFALGVFVATFVYALVVLRAVRGTADLDPFVPQLATTVAFGFVLASVVVFLGYIHHIAQSIRVATIIARIGDDTRVLLERHHPADAEPAPVAAPPAGPPTHRVPAARPGVVQRIDYRSLLRLAERHGVTIRLLRAVGEFVPAGAPLLDVYGEGLPDADGPRRSVPLGNERSLDEDVGFGLRQLVDVAERALSPGINDPTTAVQVLDQLHDLLRRLATRPLPPRQIFTEDGRLAVDIPQPGFADHLELAIDEISRWGADAERVQRRLRVMLHDVHDVARPEHRPALARALSRHAPAAGGPADPLAPSDVGLR